MKHTINLFFAAISSGLAIGLNEYLLKKGNNAVLVLVVAVSVGAVSKVLLDLLFRFLPSRIRKFFDPKAKFEGYWIIQQHQLKERPCAIAWIEYVPLSDSYVYCGRAYGKDGKLKADWFSTFLKFNIDIGQIEYTAKGQNHDEIGEYVNSWGILTFDKETNSKKYSNGHGFFVDIGTEGFRCSFEFDRITKECIKEYTDKNSLSTKEDKEKFVDAYMQRFLSNT